MFRTKVVNQIKTHVLFPVTLFLKIRAIDEIIWINIVELDRSQDGRVERAH